VGVKVPTSAIRFFTSGAWPSTVLVPTARTSMNRANTCASGMKRRVRECGLSTTSGMPIRPDSERKTKLRCHSTTPFGRPVVPEV